MKRFQHLGPVFVVAAFPVLLLTFKSMNVLIVLWSAAMFGLSFLAGESLARALPCPVALGLAIISLGGIAATLLFGWLSYGAPTPVHFGNIALLNVATVAPLSAVFAQRRKVKA